MSESPDSGEYVRTIVAGMAAREAGNNDLALERMRQAVRLFPENADEGSPYTVIAAILAERNDFKGAAEELARHNAINENSYQTYIMEARFREQAGDLAGAAAVLDRSMYIYPYDIAIHEKLADLASRTGNKRLLVRERRAIVALRPVDMAEAYYQLALALFENGETAAARREVLRSLEEAPNFGKAQELLLRIRGGDAASQGSN
jgi:tetratricopeptide (TPR) repeat protein